MDNLPRALPFSRFTTHLQRHRDAPTPSRPPERFACQRPGRCGPFGRAPAWGACLNNATHGRATTNDTCTATQTSYPNARDTLLADVTVTSSGAAAPRGLAAENGGKLSYRAARIDFQGDNGAYGMRQSRPGGSIVGGNTTIKISGPASWGAQVDGPCTSTAGWSWAAPTASA
ncbi:MAG: hypothetical protein ACTTJV_01410 [Ottowia sp.]